jgi:pimeloyl-ACP methyl ester carboxylesterase
VVCLDFPGRGRSAWLGDKSADAGYNLWQNLLDAVSLIARLDTERVDWVGTSMGGLVGMMLASLPDPPIHRLVLNDVGCLVQRSSNTQHSKGCAMPESV